MELRAADEAAGPAEVSVRSAVTGRVRLNVHGIFRREHFAQAVERHLGASPGILSVRANARTGSVLVHFSPERSQEELLEDVEHALRRAASEEGFRPTHDGGRRLPRPRVSSSTLRWLDEGIPQLTELGARYASVVRDLLRGQGQEVPRPIVAEPSEPWHTLSTDSILAFWSTNARRGLSPHEVGVRRRKHGTNSLSSNEGRSGIQIFVEQLASVPLLMLSGSAVLSLFTGGVADAVVILVVVFMNAGIGYLTESSAERTITALSAMTQREATVLRDGKVERILSEDVVPGDLLVLAPGEFVAADGRLIEAERLTVDESALTGESQAVAKAAKILPDRETPLGDRENMIYRGTVVTGGSGLAVVVATGDATEIGRISALVGSVRQPETPLQRQLGQMGSQLVVVASVLSIGVLGVGLLRGYTFLEMLRSAVSLAVAAVPEGLPTVATTALALGVREMKKHNVLVRRLSAIETLGSVQTLCLDKTGTITLNRMRALAAHVDGERRGLDEGPPPREETSEAFRRMLEVVALCSDATVELEDGEAVVRGSATEAALVRLAVDAGIDVSALHERHPRGDVSYRTDEQLYMSTIHEDRETGRRWLAVKGSPLEVLDCCRTRLVRGRSEPLSARDREVVEAENERMAGRALRVLGVAYRDLEEGVDAEAEELVWLGMVGMADPPREGIEKLMAAFHRAGIDTVMITGDQSATAHAVGKEVGIADAGKIESLDSSRITDIEPEVLSTLAQRVQIFSRVSPRHKLEIVQALQRAGRVVGMTGDGVNDGPALKAADIGIAMGSGGTEVARQVAHLVLLDDNLGSMLEAIALGRTIYDDIKKAVRFILATNMSEIAVTFLSVAAGLGQPLNPMQLLWINLLSDTFPELALVMQPPERGVLERPPRESGAPMFEREDLRRVIAEGGLMSGASLAAYVFGVLRYGQGEKASSLAFMSLTIAQLLHAVSARSEEHSVFDDEHLERNPYIPLAVGGSLALQLLVAFFPPLRRLLRTAPLGFADWIVSVLTGIAPFLLIEAEKHLRSRGDRLPGAEPPRLPAGSME